MYFENRFPESGSGQILHPVRAGQNILDLIRRPRIATILLCVDRAKVKKARMVFIALNTSPIRRTDRAACTGILPRSRWTAMRSFTLCLESP